MSVSGIDRRPSRPSSPGPGAPTCSVVVPVYDRLDLTDACLSWLAATLPDDRSVEVIVVDDGSTDARAARMLGRDGVTLVRNVERLGFAAACNRVPSPRPATCSSF